jgi:hypothetical protein
MIAVGSAAGAAEVAALCAGGVAGFEVEADCAAASATVAIVIVKTSVESTVRMDTPVSI